MSDYVKLLSNLKRKLEKESMSVLVGAGFSKNVDSDIFPSWWELISDMVKEYEEDEIKYKFEAQTKEKDFEKYLKNKINQYIDTVGPLRVVSQYMKKKGYRESVDIKIESKTPFLTSEKGKKILNYPINGNFHKKELSKYDLQTHHKLLELPWNNIYTTNYDNLLEECLNRSIEDDLRIKIKDFKKEIEENQRLLQTSKDELDQKKNEHSRITESENLSTLDSPIVSLSLEKDKSSKKKLEEIDQLNNIIFDLDRKNKQNIKNLDEASNLLDYTTAIITHSSDLSVKRNGNIIKIHGDIRTETNCEYGFDGDVHKHYVITEEDFETYPQKHEAFTQLMRISILQESFCLLGFSGIDPNFLAWISWVRDIIHKKSLTNDSEKIYLISVSKEEEKDKTLFYQNHRIVNIPLRSSECLIFLNKTTNSSLSDKSSNKELIDSFLDYLSTDAKPSRLELGFELLKQSEYDQKLSSLPTWTKNGNQAIQIFNEANYLSELRYYHRIPATENLNYRNRYHFLGTLNHYLDDLKIKKSNILSLSVSLIKDQLLPISIIFYQDEVLFEKLKTTAKSLNHISYFDFLIFEFIDSVWLNDKKKIDNIRKEFRGKNSSALKNELIYYSILSDLFNLEFKKARRNLKLWNPNGHHQLKKAGLLSLFSPKEAYSYLKSSHIETVQELGYQNELLTYLSLSSGSFDERIKFDKRAKNIKNQGLNSIRENLDQHLDEINKDEKKIVPYNHETFRTSRSRSFGGSSIYLESLQFLNLLFESGFQLHIPNIVLIKEDRIDKIFNTLAEDFPFPVLFLTLQYTDEKFIIKIAQDFTFSKQLKSKLSAIAKNIDKSFFNSDTPFRYKENCLIFFSELVNVISPNEWKIFFQKVWRYKHASKEVFNNRRIFNNYFFEKGLRYIQDLELAGEIINDTLDSIIINEDGKFDFNTAIQLLYELNFNKSITSRGTKLNSFINKENLNKIIDSLNENIRSIFVLGNLDFILSQTQKSRIKNVLSSVKNFGTSNESVWRIMMFYTQGDDQIIANIKIGVLSSEKLWNTGIEENGSYSSNNEFISLYKLRNWKSRKGITWSNRELKIIYNKLKGALNKLEGNIYKNRDLMVDYVRILQEMDWFTNYEDTGLKDIKDFQTTKQRISKLLIKQREYDNTIDAILETKNKDPYLDAINEISYKLHNFKLFAQNEYLIGLILNRVLLRVETGFNESLSIISNWFYTFYKEKSFKRFSNLVENIVVSFYLNPPENIELAFFQEKIIKLAYVLKSWKVQGKEIDEIMALLNDSQFNSIKYNLKYKISKKEAD